MDEPKVDYSDDIFSPSVLKVTAEVIPDNANRMEVMGDPQPRNKGKGRDVSEAPTTVDVGSRGAQTIFS